MQKKFNVSLTAHEIEEHNSKCSAFARSNLLLLDWPRHCRASLLALWNERSAPALYIPVSNDGQRFVPPVERIRVSFAAQDWQPWQYGHKITLDNCKSGVIIVL